MYNETRGLVNTPVMMKRTLTMALLLFAIANAHADRLSEKMEKLGFLEAEPPKPGSKEVLEANHGDAFIVELKEDLIIRPPRDGELYSPEVVFDAGSVKYIGVDRGEFGGGLYINSYNKNEKPFFSGNIDALIPINDDLYILEGLAHLVYNGGSIHVIRDYKEPSTPERVTLLPSAPEAMLVDVIHGRKRIVIAGHGSFMIFEPDYRLQITHHNTFWRSLYPSSIVKYRDFYVFGIRSGVVATATTGWDRHTIRYFKPRE